MDSPADDVVLYNVTPSGLRAFLHLAGPALSDPSKNALVQGFLQTVCAGERHVICDSGHVQCIANAARMRAHASACHPRASMAQQDVGCNIQCHDALSCNARPDVTCVHAASNNQ